MATLLVGAVIDRENLFGKRYDVPDSEGYVLVTGSARGVGRATVERLASSGYKVLAGVRQEKDLALFEESERVETVLLDLCSSGDLASLGHRLERLESPLVAVVNNAAVAPVGALELGSEEGDLALFQVNVLGPMQLVRLTVPHLRESRGRIVNIGSLSGENSNPLAISYCMSKAALRFMSDGLRRELVDFGVHSTLIIPGPIDTEMWAKAKLGYRSFLSQRHGEPNEKLYEEYEAFFPLDEIEQMHETFDKWLKVTPEHVSELVEESLRSPRPRAEYVVGNLGVKLATMVARLLPTSWIG